MRWVRRSRSYLPLGLAGLTSVAASLALVASPQRGHAQEPPTANEIAERMCHLPPAAVRVTKRAIRAGLEASFAAACDTETKYGGYARRAKHDAQESIDSFIERRAPKYTGR